MKFIVEGGCPLKGNVTISGSKNAAIKMIAASLLTEEEITLTNVPEIKDVDLIRTIAASLGVKLDTSVPHRLKIKADDITTTTVPKTLGLPSRSCIIFLGPLLARFGKAAFPEPGGDLIGKRPINWHLDALAQLGATVSCVDGLYAAEAAKLTGTNIRFRKNTVMGTENAILGATLAEGETILQNSAQEPEVDDLIEMLNKMGAKIERVEDRVIKISGVTKLSGCSHEILPDRNETITFAVGAAATRGDLVLEHTRPGNLTAFLAKLEKMGVRFEAGRDTLRVWSEPGSILTPVNIETAPHPGFMTDWQQPFCILLAQSSGESYIYETIYANRFEYVKELNRMGADIKLVTAPELHLPFKLDDESYDFANSGLPKTVAKITGPAALQGKRVNITDLRAGATLVLAALAGTGKSEIYGVEHIDRGYEFFDDKLRSLGAKIERLDD